MSHEIKQCSLTFSCNKKPQPIFVNLGTLGKNHESDSSIDKSIHSHKFRKYFGDVVVATIYLCTEAFNLIWCLSRCASTNSICNLFDKKFHHLFMACLFAFRCNHWENQTNFIYWRRKITQWHENQTEFNLRCFHHMFSPQIGFFFYQLFRLLCWWNYSDICCAQIELKEHDTTHTKNAGKVEYVTFTLCFMTC